MREDCLEPEGSAGSSVLESMLLSWITSYFSLLHISRIRHLCSILQKKNGLNIITLFCIVVYCFRLNFVYIHLTSRSSCFNIYFVAFPIVCRLFPMTSHVCGVYANVSKIQFKNCNYFINKLLMEMHRHLVGSFVRSLTGEDGYIFSYSVRVVYVATQRFWFFVSPNKNFIFAAFSW